MDKDFSSLGKVKCIARLLRLLHADCSILINFNPGTLVQESVRWIEPL
jgi:hypothetical protein